MDSTCSINSFIDKHYTVFYLGEGIDKRDLSSVKALLHNL